MTDALARVAAAVRVVPDFPQPGIMFRDITPLIGDPVAFAASIDLLSAAARARSPDAIVAVEARGFVFGAPIALALGVPLVPARKAGKLPAATHGVDYGLEYGRDRLEMHCDAITAGSRVLLFDDLLATGGTINAAASLTRAMDGDVVGALFLIELSDLGGRAVLDAAAIPSDALLSY